jgi:hypothetical protein
MNGTAVSSIQHPFHPLRTTIAVSKRIDPILRTETTGSGKRFLSNPVLSNPVLSNPVLSTG